jgi:hypothetical protein
LENYQSFELAKVLQQKYDEWEMIKLPSIIKEAKHKWILDQILD